MDAKFQNQLGPPAIQLAGLQIWAHGRQFPEAQDHSDSNWLNVTVHCGAKGAEVWVSGSIIQLSELARWVNACEEIYNTLSGRAALECMEPYLSVELDMEELGRIGMSVSITPELIEQEHKFCFEVDQSHLPSLIDSCRKVLAQYPIRG